VDDELRLEFEEFKKQIDAKLDLTRAELRVMIASVFQKESHWLHEEVDAIKRDQEYRKEVLDDLIRQCKEILRQRNAKVSTGPLFQRRRKRWAARMMELIDRQFNLDELQELCYKFDDLDYENFQGNKKQKVIGIVDWFYRRDELDELAGYCQMVRPATLWPLMLMDIPPED
jgi:hypothetical protein